LHHPLTRIFLAASQRRLMDGGIGVFAYHYLGDSAPHGPDPYLYLTFGRFRAQLSLLRNSGYSTITLSRLAESCRIGKLPHDRVVISIDDGARNFFENGMRILGEHGFHAIQFLVAGRIGGINEWDAKHGHPVVSLMDDGQIREWLAEGHEIGSHSMTHRNLLKLSEAEARAQIMDSKKQLEDRFGVAVRHFCYPHGKFNAMTEALVAEGGYESACSTRFGVNRPGCDPYALRRIAPLSATEFFGKVCHRVWRRARF
jgi:peptidoglycan/xylan/chitin deacetylase (PgdA/CDA1 family)